MFGYHIAKDKHRRTAPKSTTQSEDKVLDVSDRKKAIATTRDATRNQTLLDWIINQYLDYTTSFHFQPLTGNDELNERLEFLTTMRGKARNWDVTRRHSRERWLRILARCALVDGDVGVHRLSSGHLQGIEGDRIAKPTSKGYPADKPYNDWPITHGVHMSKSGKPLHYSVCRRDQTGYTNIAGGTQLIFDRMIDARYMDLAGYWDRFDQVRGTSPLWSAINHASDVYECLEYQLLKAKMHAMLGVFFKREGESPSSSTDFQYSDGASGEDPDADTEKYDVKFEGGGIKVEGQQGDSVDTFESKTPSNEFREFTTMEVRICMLALGIPFTFYDAKGSNYSAQKMDMGRWSKRIADQQLVWQQMLSAITRWDLVRWTTPPAPGVDPLLVLPADVPNLKDIEFEWISAGVGLLDPLKEVQANGLAVSYGFDTRDDVTRRHGGKRFADVAQQLGTEEQQAIDAGATIAIGQPGQITTRDEEEGNEANEPTGTGGNDDA